MIKTVYLSSEANKLIKDYFNDLINDKLIDRLELIYPHADVMKAIACHPDIYYCSIGSGIYEGDASSLSQEYPGDVLYNAACIGDYLICSKNTSPDLIEKSRLKPIYVKQGYTKCNIVFVDDKHIITEDRGIYETLKQHGNIKCLLINPHEVLLPGFKYGFIGGTAGRINDTIVFNGDLSKHSNFKEIYDYISSCNLKIKYFIEYPLTDIGSILTNFQEY